MSKKIIFVEHKALHLIIGMSLSEWESRYGGNADLWNMPFEELIDGTLEINEDIWYCYIDGRCYETDEITY